MEGQTPTAEQVASDLQTVKKANPLRLVTYNCKNIETAFCAFETLSSTTDIFLVQEHWYFDCQLGKLGAVCKNFNGCGKAVDTGDPILPVQMPRGYGGTAILWRKDIDHMVSVLPDGSNRIQCVEITCQNTVLAVSVYMPCRGLRDNVEEFADCISQLQEIYQKYSNSHIVIFGGDFNEDLNSQREPERNKKLKGLMQDCLLATKDTEKTYVNPDGVETSTLDYILFPACVEPQIREISRLDSVDANVSDHLPLMCLLDVDLVRATQQVETRQQTTKVKWEKVDKEEYSMMVSEKLVSVRGRTDSLAALDKEISKLNDILVRSSKPPDKGKGRNSRKPKLTLWSPDI